MLRTYGDNSVKKWHPAKAPRSARKQSDYGRRCGLRGCGRRAQQPDRRLLSGEGRVPVPGARREARARRRLHHRGAPAARLRHRHLRDRPHADPGQPAADRGRTRADRRTTGCATSTPTRSRTWRSPTASSSPCGWTGTAPSAEIARFDKADAAAYHRLLDEYDEVKSAFSGSQFTPVGFGPSLDARLAEHPRGKGVAAPPPAVRVGRHQARVQRPACPGVHALDGVPDQPGGRRARLGSARLLADLRPSAAQLVDPGRRLRPADRTR